MTLVSVAVVVYILILLGMFAFQRRLMYIPEVSIFEPEHYGVHSVRRIPLQTADGIKIEAWQLEPTDSTLPYIIYYHGNAGHVGDRIAKISHFAAAGFGALAVSYRGYGISKGSPSEEGLYADARAALQYAMTGLGLEAGQMLLYGESLGSGIATQMAREMADKDTPVAGLVLEAPYTSVARRAQEMYPFLPAFYLARDKYHSIDKIDAVCCPLLIMHGEADEVIPPHHGRALLEKAKEPKRGVFFPEVDHTGFDYPTLAGHLLEFAQKRQ